MAFVPIRTIVGTDEEDTGFKPLREVYLGPQEQRGAIAAGLSAGVDQLQGLGYSALGGVADIVGASEARDWANEQARRNQIDASVGGRPDLERIEDQTLGSALPYVGYQIAKQVPTMVGIAGAQLIPGAGQVAGAVGLTRLGAVMPRMLGGGGLQAGSSIAARRAALAQGKAFGTGTLAGSAMGFGSLYGESVEGGDPSPFKSLALAPIYGAAEAVLPAVLQGSLRAPARYSGNLGTRMAKAGGVAGAGETLTELGQNELEIGMRSDLTDEEIASRRLNAAAAGLIVGGSLGTVGGLRGPMDLTKPDTEQETQTSTEQKPILGLQYNPLAGTPIIFPDGTVALGSEQEMLARTGIKLPAAAAASAETDLTSPAGTTAAAAKVSKPAVPSLFSETDTGLNKLGVKPTKNSRAIYDYLVAENIDPASPEAEPVMNALANSKLGEARKAVGEIIRARSTRGTGISTVQQPAGGVGVGSPVVQGIVGNAGRVAPVAGAVDGGAPAAGAPLQQAGLLPVASGQPSTTVTTGAPSGPQASQTIQAAPQGQTTTTRGAAGTTALVDTSDDALEIARATGNASEIEAMREEEAGLRADQRDFTEADLNELIDEQLGKGKNKERDRKILRAYILSRRMETEGAKGDLVEEIANTFGITEDRVRQIGNPEKLAKLAVEKGFDRNQVFALLGIESAQKKVATKLGKLEGELARLKKKAKPTKADVARMAELDEQITRINDAAESGDMAVAFKEAGIEGEAGEAFGNLDDAREWQKASTAGSQMAVRLVSIADTLAELKSVAAELKQLGLAQAEAAAAARIEELTTEYQAIVSGYEAKPEAEATAPKKGKGKGKAAEKVAEEKDAAKEAEAAKFRAERAAKLEADRKGLAVGDTVMNPKLGTGVVKSFAGDGDATTVTVAFQSGQTKELSVKLAKLEKTNAVQVESAASVPVQPKAETGEKVGRQVRRVKKPAAESKAAAPTVILTQAEQAAQAWDVVAADFPEAPKFADLTKAQQDTFIGFGEGNWERGDVELELTKLAKGGMKFGKDAAVAENPYTASELLADIKDFIRADIPGRKLVIVDSINDLLNSGTLSQREVGAALQLEGAYGVAKDGVAYLVADRIQKGEGRAKFMHEVGSHLGLENLLPKATYNQLVNQIEQWAGADNGSLESQLAAKAKSRVGYAKTPTADQRDELLAYFVEEAMLAGVDPTASTKESGPLTNWFRTLWAAFKIAIRKLGFKPETLMARDVVNMAFGAARLEMNGSWHGTAAQFRKFNHAFMSSGEGAQAYGWGTYLAQSVGIAKAYWRADIARKEKLNVQNTFRQYVGWRVAETISHPVDRHAIVSANSKITETDNLVEYFKLDWSKFTTPFALANDLLDAGVDYIELVSPKGKKRVIKLEPPDGSLMRLDTAVTDDEMLDWDASFAEQPDVVRNFVKQEAANIKAVREAGANVQITSGADVLRYLIARFYKDTGLKGPWADAEPELKTRVKEQASKYMQARGIKGIRFFDADSRDSTLDNISFTKNGKTISGRDGVLKAYFTPGAIVQGYGGPDKVVKYDPVTEVVTVIAVDNNGNPRRGERERTHFTTPSVNEVGLAMQQRGYDLGASNRTRNLVIFDENDIFRAGSEVAADRQRMKFGIEGPTLQGREGGRVLELVVNGKVTQSFELVKKGLWDAFKGEGQQQLLRNKGAQEVSDRAKDALSEAQFNFRQSGPLNRVEEQVLEDLERGDIEGLRRRITMLADGGQVRSEIGSLISHAVYNTDEALNSSDKAAKYAPKWMLGQAERPAQPEQQLSRRTGPAPRMKFGKNMPAQGLIDRNIAKLPKQSQQPVKNLIAAIGDLGGKYLDYAVFTNDLVKRAQALGLGAAKTFSDRLAARNAKVSEEERKIEKIADRYASIEDNAKGSGPGSVNEFLFESTRTGKWGYGKFRDAKMGAAFDKLGPKAQQFVKDVFAHGDATLSSKKKIVLEATNSEYDAMIKAAQDAVDTATDDGVKEKASDRLAKLKAEKAATLKRFQTLFRVREGMPYAPIKRTGTYAVVAESAAFKAAKANKDAEAIKKMESDPNHYSVSFVDTKWTGRNLEASLAEAYPNLDINIVKRAEAMDDFSKNALMPALTKMRSAVTTQNTREDGKIDPSAGKLLGIINQLYLEALAEGSARKSEMRRRGVAGEVDMLQSFTQQGRADANFLASVEFEPKIQDALQQMRNQSRTGDRERKSEVFNELTQRYADSLEPKDNPFINGLTNMASKFWLASSPGYYLQNLTQPFMMSLPAMAGRHDYTKAAAELAKAYAELGPLFKDVKLFDQQFDFSKVPADVREAINDLVNQGKIDIGLATEINEYKVEADGNLSKFAQRLNKGMRMAVQKVEATNRLSTAIAAYRLEFERAKKDPKIADPKAAATQYAADILTDTHGDYTAFNAPRVFNTQWGKVALQFRKFQLIQIAFYTKLFRDLGRTPEERAVAMKTLAYSLSHTAVFAGMMGLPGYAAISFALGLFGDEDEPFDLTAWARKEIGPEWADIIMRGAPTVVGMDLSGKIGAGNMLSIMPFSDADLSTNAGRAEAFGTLMGGAALGMSSRIIDGFGLILAGDYYKGIERTMPKGVSDALKAGRQAAEGMTRRNGDVILPDSEISAIDTVLTGLGVPAVKQAVTYERQNRMRDVTENFNDRTTRIKNDYAKAVREKDTAAMAEARAAWTKLQQTRQRNGLKPQPVSNLLKAPQEQKAREQRTVGGVSYRQGQQKLAESIAEN